MDGQNQRYLRGSLRILGLLLIVLIFTIDAKASFPEKAETDISSAIESARQDLREVVQLYETDFQQRLAQEDAQLDQNEIPNWSLMAANRGK